MWVVEDPWPPLMICGLLAGVLFVVHAQRPSRGLLAAAVLLLLACPAVWFVDQAVVTEVERVEQDVYDLCWAFQRQDLPKVLGYFAARAPERLLVQTAANMVKVHDDLRVSDVQVRMVANNSRAEAHFRANATISMGSQNLGHQPSRWMLTWQREEGQWRIVKVQRLNPLNGDELSPLGTGR